MDQKDFDNAVDMFAWAGWKDFTQMLTDQENVLVQTAPDGALTNEQWQYARGQIHTLRSILGYENYILLSREQHDADPV